MGDNIGFKAIAPKESVVQLAERQGKEQTAEPGEGGGEKTGAKPGDKNKAAEAQSNFGMGKGRGAIERTFSPEFRNRLDAWIAFNPLTYADICRVVDKFIEEVKVSLGEKKVKLHLTVAAGTWFADKGFDRQFGARPMARIIKQKLREPLADELLFGKLEHGGSVNVDVKDGELTIECIAKEPHESDAEIESDKSNDNSNDKASDKANDKIVGSPESKSEEKRTRPGRAPTPAKDPDLKPLADALIETVSPSHEEQ
jgi:hypothetical protein